MFLCSYKTHVQTGSHPDPFRTHPRLFTKPRTDWLTPPSQSARTVGNALSQSVRTPLLLPRPAYRPAHPPSQSVRTPPYPLLSLSHAYRLVDTPFQFVRIPPLSLYITRVQTGSHPLSNLYAVFPNPRTDWMTFLSNPYASFLKPRTDWDPLSNLYAPLPTRSHVQTDSHTLPICTHLNLTPVQTGSPPLPNQYAPPFSY